MLPDLPDFQSRWSSSMNHCIARIVGIIAEGRDDRRSIFQLGYNLGRLSELTGLGREPFWDRWKDAIRDWDVSRIQQLAHELLLLEIQYYPPRPLGSESRADPGETLDDAPKLP